MRCSALLTLMIGFFPALAWSQTTGTGGTTNNNTQTNIISISSAGYSAGEGQFFNDLNTSSTILHGGLAGGEVGGCLPGTRSSSSVCNNCQADLESCNTRRIHDDLNFTVQFRPNQTADTTAPNGGVVFVSNGASQASGQQEILTITNANPSGLIIADQVAAVSVTLNWGDICEKFFEGTSGCTNAQPGTRALNLAIDTNNDNIFDETGVQSLQVSISTLDIASTTLCASGDTGVGVCNFIAYPGDEKVIIEGVRTGCSFPSVSGSTIERIRFFYEEGAGSFPNALSPSKDLVIGSTTGDCTTSKEISLSDNEVDSLTNGTTYHFGAAILDQANNMGGILDMSAGIGNTDPNDSSSCFSPDPDYDFNCHIATPDEVLGLIEKEFDCFITTATYGSPFRPKVEDFRAFRNRFLHSNWVGRKIIKFYYWVSPSIADWIREHPGSKPVMRKILYPFWLFAKACLLYPMVTVTSLLLLFTGLFWRLSARRVGR